MNGIAAKITQKVGVLFQHQDFDPGAGEQQSQHHPGGTAAGNTATDRNLPGRQRLYSRRLGNIAYEYMIT